jgi:copper(I)-binding protein
MGLATLFHVSTSGPGRSARRLGIAVAGVLLAAGCAAGQHAQTAQVRPGIDGTLGSVGAISLDGVAVHAPSGASYAKGSNAQLALTIVNDGTSPDTLVSVTSPSFAGWGIAANSDADTSTPTATGLTIQPGTAQRLGVADLGGSADLSDRTVVLTSLEQQLFPGNTVEITFRFARSGSATLRVPVQLRDAPSEGATLQVDPSESAEA